VLTLQLEVLPRPVPLEEVIIFLATWNLWVRCLSQWEFGEEAGCELLCNPRVILE